MDISISGCFFCSQSMNLWKLGASRFHLQLAMQPRNRSECIHVEGVLVQQRPGPFKPQARWPNHPY